MARITREVRINAPQVKVWEILADFGNISMFNPNVPHSYSTSQQRNGVGATRHCDLTLNGASIEERIMQWNDGQSMSIEIYDGTKTPPFKQATANIALRKDGNDTIVTGTFDYTLKFGLLGAFMDILMVAPQFSRAWSRLFAGLKHYIETGETVDAETRVDLQPVMAVAR